MKLLPVSKALGILFGVYIAVRCVRTKGWGKNMRFEEYYK